VSDAEDTLTSVPPPGSAGEDAVDAVDVLRLRAREASMAAAALLAAVVMVAGAAEPGFEADEVGFALSWTQTAARRQVDFGRWLTGELPDVFAALALGDIDVPRAWVFYDQLATVEPAVALSVAAAILPVAGGLTTSQLRDRLRRAVLKADPGAAAARTRRSEAERYVATSPDGDGTASLYGVRLPAGRTMAAFERVDAYARARKRDGDMRNLDQLRADTFLDLLEGITIDTPPVHRTGVIELTVPWDTAIGLGDDPGVIAGYGPVAASIARDLAQRYSLTDTHSASADMATKARRGGQGAKPRWRYSVTAADGSLLMQGAIRGPIRPRPNDNALVAQPRPCAPVEVDPLRRIPGAALTRWIMTRDRTCRAPGCRVPARAADIDHTRDHADGGPTAHDNLAVLCRHHHRAKHQAGWTVTQPEPGHLVWKSSTGRTYHRTADPP